MKPIIYSREKGIRTPKITLILKALEVFQREKYEMAHTGGIAANFFAPEKSDDNSIDFNAVSKELERWESILKHEDTTILRGPRP